MKIARVIAIGCILYVTSSYGQDVANPLADIPATGYKSKQEALEGAGLIKYESSNNRKIIEQISSNESELSRILGDSFAGTWVEYDKNYNAYQVIASTRPVQIKKALQTDGGSRVVLVRYSLNTLSSLSNYLAKHMVSAQGDPIIFSLSLNIQENKLIVRARPEYFELIQRRVSEGGYDVGAISFEEQVGPSMLFRTLTGGQKIVYSEVGTSVISQACTAGFNAYSGVYPLMLTAGHCAVFDGKTVFFDNAPIGSWGMKSDLIGGTIGSYFNAADKMDVSVFANANFVHYQPAEYYHSYVSYPVRAPLSIPANSSLCYQGGMSGWRCGKLRTSLAVHQVPDLKGGYIKINFSEADSGICGQGGDSGGPVVTPNGNALGLFAGAVGNYPTGNCSAFGGGAPAVSVFQSLTPFLSRFPNVIIKSIA